MLIQQSPAADPPRPVEARKPSSEDPQAQNLWAKALWLSISDLSAPEEKISALFTAALSRANNKAPIYISFAEMQSGAIRVREMRAVLTKVEKQINDHITSEVEKSINNIDLNDQEAVREALEKALEESYRKLGENKSVKQDMVDLAESFGKPSDASIGYYLAAIGENPKYLPAWYHLATTAKGKLLNRAVREFKRLDPKNALPWYLHAQAQMEEGNIQETLKLVQLGNEKPMFRPYPAPMPEQFELRYPKRKDLQKYQVVGKRIPPSALRFLLSSYRDQWSWAGSLHGDLRNLSRELIDEGRRLVKDGKVAEGTGYLEASRKMSFQLMRDESRDALIMLTGIAHASVTYVDLKEIYKTSANVQKQTRLERTQSAKNILIKEIRKSLEIEKKTIDDLRPLFLGEKDFLKERKDRYTQALKKAGLLNESPNKSM